MQDHLVNLLGFETMKETKHKKERFPLNKTEKGNIKINTSRRRAENGSTRSFRISRWHVLGFSYLHTSDWNARSGGYFTHVVTSLDCGLCACNNSQGLVARTT